MPCRLAARRSSPWNQSSLTLAASNILTRSLLDRRSARERNAVHESKLRGSKHFAVVIFEASHSKEFLAFLQSLLSDFGDEPFAQQVS